MNSFPPDVRFRKPWRSYQQRVLDELKDHLDDDHLHIIAAPGSGKTVLGLEVLRQLNRPVLVLSPTVAIRDQWVDRFIHSFLDAGQEVPAWISRDIRHPQFFTASTYQGLHSVYTGGAGNGERRTGGRNTLLRRLQEIGVRTLVLDEAHHLRNEWWKCLADLKKHLDKPTVVALTATAPFDVSPFEWDRYIDLCGPIDSEISVPELVAQKNLCPHQDYVYLSAPLQAEQQEIREFRKTVEVFVQDLCANQEFIAALENHPCVSTPQTCVEEILDDPPFYSSVAFFLSNVRDHPPRPLLRTLGLSSRTGPQLDAAWLTILLTGCFYTHAKSFEAHKDLFHRLLREAKRIGVVDRRTVGLQSSTKIARLFTRSASKLRSIEEIVQLESDTLGPDLRMVILTDFVRRADFPTDEADEKPIKRLGVVPIFEHLRRSAAGPMESPSEEPVPTSPGEADGCHAQTCLSVSAKLGILTGTLTVLPSEACASLRSTAPGLGLDPADIAFKPLAHDSRFCEVTIRGADKHKMVALITGLFNQGSINTLVGTTSLLGEGWDAPSVNALILASFVGSYMLSNQMRGRAIRTQDGNPTKTANIWHLVCQEQDATQLNEDMETLSRRFKSFVGVSFTSNRIESGLGRLGLGGPPYAKARMDRINGVMRQRARDRTRLITDWEHALDRARDENMVEQVAASQLALPRDFVFRHTLGALLWQAWFWGISVFSMLMQSPKQNSQNMSLRASLILIAIASAAGALAALPKCLKALWLFLRHGSVASSMKQIGKVVLKSLIQGELIGNVGCVPRTASVHRTRHADGAWYAPYKVVARPIGYGFVGCSLKGGTTRERSIFLDALQEVLGPIENPRYVLVRRSWLGRLRRQDYHAVPAVLGKNKDLADYFRQMWSRHVGPTDLVYTRTPEGRLFLLKARTHSMSQSFQRRAERLKSWQ